jgi:8-oxo-dGTP pyrophosphatase MutT (NUDIX family)
MSDQAPIPGIRVHTLNGAFSAITILPAPEPPWAAAHEQAWQHLCATNPKLHDGPIWSATRVSASRLTVTLDRYRRLAIQADPTVGDLGVRHVGIKGLTTATDAAGVTRTLLARRGPHTRAYPNMWEIAPAGGVEAHKPLSPESIIETLVQEAGEELGIDASSSAPAIRPLLLLEDEVARSAVFVATLPWPGPFDPSWKLPATGPAAWEYSATRWLTHQEITQLLSAHPSDVTPPTRAALSFAQRAS